MALTREQQQFILDVLADVCSEQHGISMSFILKEPTEVSEEVEQPAPDMLT